MKARKAPDICYLCGKPLGNDRTRDHVPAQSFFPEPLRKRENFSKLDVAITHSKCNNDYKLDEEYFFRALAPLARATEAGPAIWEVVDKPILTPGEWRLQRRAAREFSVDSNGQVRKTFEHARIYRVAKKIVRGLHFLRWHTVMPEAWRYDFNLHDPVNPPPKPLLQILSQNVGWGEYPDIFFCSFIRSEQLRYQLWVLFFWNWVLIPVGIHETACCCAKCAPSSFPLEESIPTNTP